MAEKTTAASAPAANTRQIAQFVGHVGTRRIITKKDQDALVGVNGIATDDLVWEPGNKKVDVTDVHEDVLAYLKGDAEFKIRAVEAPAEKPKA